MQLTNQIHFRNLRGDLFGGVTAAVIALPMALAFTVVMMAGLCQIIFGSLRLGKYVTMMPYKVISGFMSGIGMIRVILQLAPFLGQVSPAARRRLKDLKVLSLLPPHHLFDSRSEALKYAAAAVALESELNFFSSQEQRLNYGASTATV